MSKPMLVTLPFRDLSLTNVPAALRGLETN
jgi:hypothetical protein